VSRRLPNGYRLWLDLQAVQSVHHSERGIGRYVREHARSLVLADAPIAALSLNPHRPRPVGLEAELADATTLCWSTASEHRARSEQAPLIHHVMSPYEDEPASRLFPPYLGPHDRLVATVYDLIPDVFPERYLVDVTTHERFRARRRLLEAADLLLCISERTRRDLLELFDVDPSLVHVIGAGVSTFFCPPGPDDPPLAVAGVERPYVLSVTGFEWRKNTELLFRAWGALPQALREAHQLVVACSLDDHARSAWAAEAMACGLAKGDYAFTGRVSDEELRALYRGAELFVFPSRYEGFGLPVVEAGRCGTPVVAAATSSVSDLLRHADAGFDPEDAEGLAALIGRALDDGSFRRELRSASIEAAELHTWDRVAARTVAAYAALPEAPLTRRYRRRRSSLAIVGPFPPTQSGVAVYTAKVVDALDGRVDIDCYVEHDLTNVLLPELATAGRVIPIELFGRDRGTTEYDAVIFVLGNSRYHVRTLDLALDHPGIAWLHDVSLSHLAVSRAHGEGSADGAKAAMQRMLTETYGDQVPDRLLHEDALDPDAFALATVRFAALAVRRARHVVVSSDLARHEVAFDLGGDAAHVPITVLPLAAPRPTPRREPAAPPVIASLGVVGPSKRPTTLVDALACLQASDARLRFVGPCAEQLAEELREHARRAGVEDRVDITGWVTADRYAQEIRSSSIVVQLRSHSHGESSAAVLDALAHGVPVVTSVASCAELPAGAVAMVTQHAGSVEIAAAIDRLLDPGSSAAASAAGLAYAGSWSIDAVADALLDVLDSLSSRPVTTPG